MYVWMDRWDLYRWKNLNLLDEHIYSGAWCPKTLARSAIIAHDTGQDKKYYIPCTVYDHVLLDYVSGVNQEMIF